MTEFLAQFGPLAQGSGFEDWANILFLVVVAALWLLGALVKAIGGRKSTQTQPDQERTLTERRQSGGTWQERLVRKADEVRRRLQEEAGLEEPQRRRPPAREPGSRPPQSPGGKVTVRTGPRGESVMVYEPSQRQPSAQREQQATHQREAQRAVTAARQYTTIPKVELARREGSEAMSAGLPLVMAEPTEPLEPDRVQLTTQREHGGYEPTAVIDYSDPEALKKAILHYEIFGKPLALRDASDETAAF